MIKSLFLDIYQNPLLNEAAKRRQQALIILNNLDSFKVCNSCDSISFKSVDSCPVCSNQHFNDDHTELINTARQLGSRPARTIPIPEDFS